MFIGSVDGSVVVGIGIICVEVVIVVGNMLCCIGVDVMGIK